MHDLWRQQNCHQTQPATCPGRPGPAPSQCRPRDHEGDQQTQEQTCSSRLFFFFFKGNVCYLESYLKYTYSKSRAHGLASSFSQGVHDCLVGQLSGWVCTFGEGLGAPRPWQCSAGGNFNCPQGTWVGSLPVQARLVGGLAVGPVTRDLTVSSTHHLPAFAGGDGLRSVRLTRRYASTVPGEQVPSPPVPERP